MAPTIEIETQTKSPSPQVETHEGMQYAGHTQIPRHVDFPSDDNAAHGDAARQTTEKGRFTQRIAGGLAAHWEEILLGTMIAGIVAMILYVLWPTPRATITLTPLTNREAIPLPAHSVMNLPPSNAENGMDGDLPEFSAEGAMPGDEDADRNGLTVSRSDSPQSAGRKKSLLRRIFQFHKKKPAKPPVTNLNTATSAQLQLLPGVGPKMAGRILEYRRAHGRFTSIDGVMDVRGIGPRKFDKMRPFLKI